MSEPKYDAIRAGRPDCPNDFELDRFHTGELGKEAAELVARHLATCDLCEQRLAMRDSKFDIAPDVDPREIMAFVRRNLEAEASEGVLARWGRWIGALALVGGAAAAAVFVLSRDPVDPIGPEPPVNRMKGTLKLDLHRQRGAGSELLEAGATVAPGTRLKFVVTLPGAGQVKIIGQEASGALYDAWPLEGQDPERDAGRQTLPGAVQLDGALGRETFHLVFCPEGPIRCEATDTQTPPKCPAACRLHAVPIEKAPPP